MSAVRAMLPEPANEYIMYYVGLARSHITPYISNKFEASTLASEPRMMLGGLESASNLEGLKEHGITHILCVYNGGVEYFPGEFEYKTIHVNDDPWVELHKKFDETTYYIDQALTSSPSNKILIHCQRGASRSATVAIAYLLFKINRLNKIKERDIETIIDSVTESIRDVRDIVYPNHGFIECLHLYVRTLNGYPLYN